MPIDNVPTPLWAPRTDRAATLMGQFMDQVNQQYALNLASFDDLYQWSISEPDRFWAQMGDSILWTTRTDEVVTPGDHMTATRWFKGAQLNYAENCLRYDGDGVAIYEVFESGAMQTMSWCSLREDVSRWVQYFRTIGLRKGDRVAAILPNGTTAVVAMLATSAIGGVWSSCSPDFGAQGILDRLGQIGPKCLISVGQYTYKQKPFRITDTLTTLRDQLTTPSHWLLTDDTELTGWSSTPDWAAFDGSLPISFTPCSFDDPLFIMFSSGTTGPPKCMIHSVGGTLIQHIKEHQLHCDLRPDDCLFFYTTCGWMMWNWMVSALASQVAIVLYDGAPLMGPDHSIWQLLHLAPITAFGCSAGFISASQKHDLPIRSLIDNSDLTLLLSTGSPLLPAQFDWLYSQFPRPVQVGSISGGTDIISCFALCNPLSPVFRGQIQGRGLGMDVVAWDEQGHPIRNTRGELVCRSAAPCMPIGFVGDDDTAARYKNAYFMRHDRPCSVWVHGDFMILYDHGGIEMLGRSDATLNPGGVRMGSAEFYHILEPMTELTDSLVTSRTIDDQEHVILFVQLAPNVPFTDSLQVRIRQTLKQEGSPRHVPYDIVNVRQIPVTKSNKKCELTVKRLLNGQFDPKSRAVLSDPSALDDYIEYATHTKGVRSC